MAELPAAALRLVFVTPDDREPSETLALVEAVLDGGATAILLREPQLEARARGLLADAVFAAVRAAGACGLLSREPALAEASGAHGVQLGFGCESPSAVRARHPRLAVTRSAHWPLVDDDLEADAVTLSPFRPTHRSQPRPLLVSGQVEEALRALEPRPVVALGGLDARSVGGLPAGLAGVAVVRALADAPDPRGAAAVLRSAVDTWLAFGPSA